jgi:hypothetical protein
LRSREKDIIFSGFPAILFTLFNHLRVSLDLSVDFIAVNDFFFSAISSWTLFFSNRQKGIIVNACGSLSGGLL